MRVWTWEWAYSRKSHSSLQKCTFAWKYLTVMTWQNLNYYSVMCSSRRFHVLCCMPHLHLPQKGDLERLKRSEQRALRLLLHPGMAVYPSPPDQLRTIRPPAQEAVRERNRTDEKKKKPPHSFHFSGLQMIHVSFLCESRSTRQCCIVRRMLRHRGGISLLPSIKNRLRKISHWSSVTL